MAYLPYFPFSCVLWAVVDKVKLAWRLKAGGLQLGLLSPKWIYIYICLHATPKKPISANQNCVLFIYMHTNLNVITYVRFALLGGVMHCFCAPDCSPWIIFRMLLAHKTKSLSRYISLCIQIKQTQYHELRLLGLFSLFVRRQANFFSPASGVYVKLG